MQSKLKILTGVFSIVILIWAVQTYGPKPSSTVSPYEKNIAELKNQEVKRISVNRKSSMVELTKDGPFWKVAGKKAESKKIDKVLTMVFPLGPPEVVTKKDADPADFGLVADTATSVQFNNHAPTFLTGKAQGNGLYLGFSDQPTIFLLHNLSPGDLSPDPTFWFDKQIFALNRIKLLQFSLTKNGKTKTITQKDGAWISDAKGKEINREALDPFFLTIDSLVADSVASESAVASYKNPSLSLTLEFQGGKETLDFSTGKDDYLVKRTTDGELFILSSAQATKIYDLDRDL